MSSTRIIDPECLPKDCELVDGRLCVKKKGSFLGGFVTMQLMGTLSRYLDKTQIGILVGGDAPFACVPGKPRQIRKPDLAILFVDPRSFVPPVTNCMIAPAMIAEVWMPNDSSAHLRSRIIDFLESGTQQAWVVNPINRYLEIHHANGQVNHFKTPAVVTCDLLPGFELPLAKLFG